jgi:hypothetical protein
MTEHDALHAEFTQPLGELEDVGEVVREVDRNHRAAQHLYAPLPVRDR